LSQNGHVGSKQNGKGGPRPVWPDGAIHHGIRFLILFVLAGVVTMLFPPASRGGPARYSEGQVLEEDVIAEVTFSIPKNLDELMRDQDDAAAGVPPTFDYRPEAIDTMTARLNRFFDGLDAAAKSGDPVQVGLFLSNVQLGGDSTRAALMLDEGNRTLLRRTATQAARELLTDGLIETSQTSELTAGRVWVRDPATGERVARSESSIHTPREFYVEVVSRLQSADLDLSELLRLITIRHTEYSLSLNVVVTESDRAAASQSVQTTKGQVLEREAVARANQRLTADDIERLQAYQAELSRLGRLETATVTLAPFVGALLLQVLLFGVYGMMLFFFRREVYGNLRYLLLQAFLLLVYFGAARVVVTNEAPLVLLPIAFVTLAVAVLWDSRMALVLGLVTSAVTFSLPGLGSEQVLFAAVMGGAAAAFSVRVVRRRAQTWVFIALITAAYFGVLLASTLLTGTGVRELGLSLLWAGANASVSGMIAMGMVPVFEWFTGITTDQTLLEWADPNRNLLRRLSLEAPGTYAHTINVANLGEMGANAIGANGLLCRVGLYYHDVGKVLKPHFFVENQPEGRNPHDKLKPRVSAGIVREHVTEGARLGREEKLPEVIRDFILEHHGTQLIAYFYSNAVEEEGTEAVSESDFRYPGPRPQSKETAISMMADSIESATRVLQDPTPERVRNLVGGIVDSKMQDGQLDEAPLTLREIATLKETFVKVLSGSYHHRIDYPTTKHLTDSPDAGGGGPESSARDDSEASSAAGERGPQQHQMDLSAPDGEGVAGGAT
jgi:cyclic-di-AMP phosphodiesterase PgpH